jgi:hypothetical protein
MATIVSINVNRALSGFCAPAVAVATNRKTSARDDATRRERTVRPHRLPTRRRTLDTELDHGCWNRIGVTH